MNLKETKSECTVITPFLVNAHGKVDQAQRNRGSDNDLWAKSFEQWKLCTC